MVFCCMTRNNSTSLKNNSIRGFSSVTKKKQKNRGCLYSSNRKNSRRHAVNAKRGKDLVQAKNLYCKQSWGKSKLAEWNCWHQDIQPPRTFSWLLITVVCFFRLVDDMIAKHPQSLPPSLPSGPASTLPIPDVLVLEQCGCFQWLCSWAFWLVDLPF